MSKKIWIVLGLVLIAIVGARLYSLNREHAAHSEATLVSQYLEGFETPPPSPTVSPKPNLVPRAQGSKALSPKDQVKFSVLKEILNSKNDNDSRLDTELDQLSPELKQAMIQYYRELPREKLNQRGTVVFLVGRSLNTVEDVAFIQSVLMEKPCLSLGNCQEEVREEDPEARHMGALNETTLNYPQLMGLRKSMEAYSRLSQDPNASPEVLSGLQQMLKQATQSPNPRVAFEAEKALKRIEH